MPSLWCGSSTSLTSAFWSRAMRLVTFYVGFHVAGGIALLVTLSVQENNTLGAVIEHGLSTTVIRNALVISFIASCIGLALIIEHRLRRKQSPSNIYVSVTISLAFPFILQLSLSCALLVPSVWERRRLIWQTIGLTRTVNMVFVMCNLLYYDYQEVFGGINTLGPWVITAVVNSVSVLVIFLAKNPKSQKMQLLSYAAIPLFIFQLYLVFKWLSYLQRRFLPFNSCLPRIPKDLSSKRSYAQVPNEHSSSINKRVAFDEPNIQLEKSQKRNTKESYNSKKHKKKQVFFADDELPGITLNEYENHNSSIQESDTGEERVELYSKSADFKELMEADYSMDNVLIITFLLINLVLPTLCQAILRLFSALQANDYGMVQASSYILATHMVSVYASSMMLAIIAYAVCPQTLNDSIYDIYRTAVAKYDMSKKRGKHWAYKNDVYSLKHKGRVEQYLKSLHISNEVVHEVVSRMSRNIDIYPPNFSYILNNSNSCTGGNDSSENGNHNNHSINLNSARQSSRQLQRLQFWRHRSQQTPCRTFIPFSELNRDPFSPVITSDLTNTSMDDGSQDVVDYHGSQLIGYPNDLASTSSSLVVHCGHIECLLRRLFVMKFGGNCYFDLSGKFHVETEEPIAPIGAVINRNDDMAQCRPYTSVMSSEEGAAMIGYDAA